MQPSELLDLLKRAYNLESDYQVMKKFGFSQTGVSHWRCNRSFPKSSVLVQFGELLDINAGLLMLYSLAWREKDPKAKKQLNEFIEILHHAKFDDAMPSECA